MSRQAALKRAHRILLVLSLAAFAFVAGCYFFAVRPEGKSVYALDGALRFVFWAPLALGVAAMLASTAVKLGIKPDGDGKGA